MVELVSGTWAANDAAGYFYVKTQSGTFEAELVKVSTTSTANALSDSEKNVRTDIPCTAHGLSDGDYCAIKGTVNYDNPNIEVLGAPDTDHIVIEEDYVAETFTGNEILYYPANKLVFESAHTAEQLTGDEEIYVILPNAKEIDMTHSGEDPDGYYIGNLPDTVKGLVLDAWYFLFVEMTKDSSDRLAIVPVHVVKYEGEES